MGRSFSGLTIRARIAQPVIGYRRFFPFMWLLATLGREAGHNTQ
jgi:hypothetical protein